MDRRSVLAGLGAAASAGLGGCAALGLGGDDYDVGMAAVAFRPAELTVSVGETVVWENTSSRGHTVTAYDNAIPDGAVFFASGGFESTSAAREAFRENAAGEGSGTLTTGDRFSHTFEVPGRYEYFCIPHERAGMVGTVVVEG